MRFTKCALMATLVMGIFSFYHSVLRADDINPADWRGEDSSMTYEFVDLDLGLGGGSYGLSVTDPIGPYELSDQFQEGHDLYLDEGGLTIGLSNYIDDEPIKDIRVQITYSGDEPYVESIEGWNGFDQVYGNQVTYHADDPWNVEADGYFYVDWIMEPNPDYELIYIQHDYPQTTYLQIVIDTWSHGNEVPEPSLGLLLGISLIALVGVGAVRKIKQKAVVKVKS